MSEHILANVVGFAIINNENFIDCVNLNSFIDIGKNNNQVAKTVNIGRFKEAEVVFS